MHNLIKSILLCLVLVSCKALPETNYARLAHNWSKSREISEIVNYNASVSLHLNEEFNDNLSLSDSILKINSSIWYLTNYKIFKSYGIAGKTYKATLYGFCDCYGLRKYLFKPLFAILDSEGNLITTHIVRHEIIMLTSQYSNTIPYHSDFEWEYTLPKTGDYKIIVYSFNEDIGNAIKDKDLIHYPGFRFNIVGDFMIAIQEE